MARGWGNQIYPTIREIVNEVKRSWWHYHVLLSELNQFELRGSRDAYEVNTERKTYSCML